MGKLGQEPAFPVNNLEMRDLVSNGKVDGISKRLYIATAAMQGFISAFYSNNDTFINMRKVSKSKEINDVELVSKMAYEYADELLKNE